MYNSTQSSGDGNFNRNLSNNNNNNNEKSKTLFTLRLLAGSIGGLAILKLIAGDYNGFNSDLMSCIFIFLTTYCVNGFLAGFLVISLLFSVILTSVFFALQIQNSIFDIPDTISKNKLVFLYIINCLGMLFYSFAIYYCYKFYTVSVGENARFGPATGGYSLMNSGPAPQQRGYYGSLDSNENNGPQQQVNFKAFAGSGVKLDA